MSASCACILTGAGASVRNMSASDSDMLRPAWSHFCHAKSVTDARRLFTNGVRHGIRTAHGGE